MGTKTRALLHPSYLLLSECSLPLAEEHQHGSARRPPSATLLLTLLWRDWGAAVPMLVRAVGPGARQG